MSLKDTLFLKTNSELTRDFVFAEEEVPDKKYYSGKVVDNTDPDKDMRVKVRVYGLYGNEIPDGDLPWARQDDGFVGSQIGSYVVPPVGAIVKVYFDFDDIYSPIYTTKVPTNNVPEDIKNDYPNNMAFFISDEGDSCTLNRASGLFTFIHRTGSTFMIDKEGNINVMSKGSLNLEAENDISMVAKNGSINAEAESGYINLGKGAIIPVSNLPQCLANGSPHALCGQAITMKGIARVKK